LDLGRKDLLARPHAGLADSTSPGRPNRLFAACAVTNIGIEQMIPHLLPLVALIAVCLLVVTFVPTITLFLVGCETTSPAGIALSQRQTRIQRCRRRTSGRWGRPGSSPRGSQLKPW